MLDTLITLIGFILTSILIVGLIGSVLNGHYILAILFTIPFVLMGGIYFYMIKENDKHAN